MHITNKNDKINILTKRYKLSNFILQNKLLDDFATNENHNELYIIFSKGYKIQFATQSKIELRDFIEKKILNKKAYLMKKFNPYDIYIINIKLAKIGVSINQYNYISDYFHYYFEYPNYTNALIRKFLFLTYQLNKDDEQQCIHLLNEIESNLHFVDYKIMKKKEINEFFWNRAIGIICDGIYFLFKFLDIIGVALLFLGMVLFVTIKHSPIMFSLYFINTILKIVLIIKKWKCWPSNHILHLGAFFDRTLYLLSEFVISLINVAISILSALFTIMKVISIFSGYLLFSNLDFENFLVRIIVIITLLIDFIAILIDFFKNFNWIEFKKKLQTKKQRI